MWRASLLLRVGWNSSSIPTDYSWRTYELFVGRIKVYIEFDLNTFALRFCSGSGENSCEACTESLGVNFTVYSFFSTSSASSTCDLLFQSSKFRLNPLVFVLRWIPLLVAFDLSISFPSSFLWFIAGLVGDSYLLIYASVTLDLMRSRKFRISSWLDLSYRIFLS